MNKYPWFTHDNDAHTDKEMRRIFRKRGGILKGWGLWWILTEVLDRDGNGDRVRVDWAELEQSTGSKRSYVRAVLEDLHQAKKLQIVSSDDELVVYENKNFRKRNANRKTKITSTSSEGPAKAPVHIEEQEQKEKQTPKPKRRAPSGYQEFMDTFLREYLNLEPGKQGDEGMKVRVNAAYRRFGKAARDVFDSAGRDKNFAIRGLHAVAARFEKRGWEWTLDTVAKHFPDWAAGPKEYENETKTGRRFA